MGNHRQPRDPLRITKVDDADIDRMIGGEAEQQAELYRHMLECAKASGFGSLSEAIARAVKAEAENANLRDIVKRLLDDPQDEAALFDARCAATPAGSVVYP